MEIRTASAGDASALLDIYDYYVKNTAVTFEYDTPSLAEFRGRMEGIMVKYPYLVAEEAGAPMGYAYAGPFHSRAAYGWSCETTVYLRPDARRMGLGRALYGELELELREIGVLNLYACIASPIGEDAYLSNDSELFHQRMGFARVGEFHRCGFKFGRWYDMIWMEKLIGEHKPDQPPVGPPAAKGD